MTLRADAFADALDGTATDLLDDTELMLGVVERLHGLPGTAALSNAGARPDFRSQLRARLIEEAVAASTPEPHATVVPITSRWNQSWARRNRTRLLTSAAAGIVVVTAVSIGASSSLPGNPLYPLKRGGESVEYALAGSDEARGKLELSFARTRLDEIGQLTSHDAAFGIAPVAGVQAAGGSTVLATSTNTWVVRLFGDMDHNANQGSTLLQRSFKNHPRPAPLREVQEFAQYQEAQPHGAAVAAGRAGADQGHQLAELGAGRGQVDDGSAGQVHVDHVPRRASPPPSLRPAPRSPVPLLPRPRRRRRRACPRSRRRPCPSRRLARRSAAPTTTGHAGAARPPRLAPTTPAPPTDQPSHHAGAADRSVDRPHRYPAADGRPAHVPTPRRPRRCRRARRTPADHRHADGRAAELNQPLGSGHPAVDASPHDASAAAHHACAHHQPAGRDHPTAHRRADHGSRHDGAADH